LDFSSFSILSKLTQNKLAQKYVGKKKRKKSPLFSWVLSLILRFFFLGKLENWEVSLCIGIEGFTSQKEEGIIA
jgi:hypothetical protein